MSELSERLRDGWSRLGDQRTQLTLASVIAVIVIVAAIVAWPSSDNANDAGSISEQAAEAADDIASKLGEKTKAEGEGIGGTLPGGGPRAGATVSADDPEVPPAANPKAPPITESYFKVGIAYTADAGATNQAAGFATIGQVDQKRAWDAMIKAFNANPPFGRKLVPVFFRVTEQEIISKGTERLQQEACAHYTQDNKVFMTWDGPIAGEILSECLKKAKVAEVGYAFDSETMKKYPYLVAPTDSTRDRMVAFEVDQLAKNGFFKKFKDNPPGYLPVKPADGKPLIGLIRYDQPEWDIAAAAMKSRLQAHGLALCKDCEYQVAYSSDNPKDMLDDAGEINQAIQLFKTKGVTHVLFIGTLSGARITLFYIDGAEKQNYRAMLGFNPEDAPSVVRDFYGSSSYPQFRESMVVADGPGEYDVDAPGFTACKKLSEASGETYEGNSASNKEAQIPLYCDTLWYTRGVLQKAGADLTLDSWMNAAHTMEPVDSASVYLMQTKQGRHDGSGAVRTGRWADDCNCFKPITPITPV